MRELTDAFDDRVDRARRRRLFEHKRPPAVLVHREQIGKRASNIDAHAKGTIHTATKRIRAAPSRVQDADTFTLPRFVQLGADRTGQAGVPSCLQRHDRSRRVVERRNACGHHRLTGAGSTYAGGRRGKERAASLRAQQ